MSLIKIFIFTTIIYLKPIAGLFAQLTNPLMYDAYFNNAIVVNIYFPANFVDGKFSQWAGKEAAGKLRFNLKSGQPEKLEDEKILNLSSITTSFSLKTDEKMTLNFRKGFKAIGSNDENTYYLILFDGKLKFIAQLRVFETTSTDYTNPGQMSYTPVITYYLVNETGEIAKLSSKKSILKIPEINQSKSKDFLKKTSNKLKEWTDVQKVIEFNNSLLPQ
jgi:hypothetical protein